MLIFHTAFDKTTCVTDLTRQIHPSPVALDLFVWSVSHSYSKSLAKSVQRKFPTIDIWSPSTSDQIPHSPPLVSHHPSMPSARVLSTQISQYSPSPLRLPPGNFPSTGMHLLLGCTSPFVLAVFTVDPGPTLRSPFPHHSSSWIQSVFDILTSDRFFLSLSLS